MSQREFMVISTNTAQQIRDADSFAALLAEMEEFTKQWDAILIQEFDGFACERTPPPCGPHHVFRHWPGPGSVSMGIVIHDRVRPLLRSIHCHGRAMSAYFNNDMELNVTLINSHGGHGEALLDSLTDISFLIKKATKSSGKVVCGDFNVDQLPTLPNDPWQHLRSADHSSRARALLLSLCDTFKFEVVLPLLGSEPTAGPHRSLNEVCSFTRVPSGEQSGLPSFLDYTLSKPHTVSSTRSFWNSFSDHAFIVSELKCAFRPRPRRPKSTWREACWDSAVQMVTNTAPDRFTSIEHLLDYIKHIQAITGDNTPCSLRRSLRETPSIKNIRLALKRAANTRDVKQLKAQLWNERKLFWQKLREDGECSKLQRGSPVTKARKLRPITRMLNADGNVTIDHNDWKDLAHAEFTKKWQSGCPHRRSVLQDELARHHGVALQGTCSDFIGAAERLGKQFKLDNQGICPRSLRLVLAGAKDTTTDILNRLLSDDDFFSNSVVDGRTAAKVSGPALSSQIRSILPMPTILMIFDCIIDKELQEIVSQAASQCSNGYLECAIRRRQILDCTFALTMHLEKCLDAHGKGAIAGADIKAFYDTLDPLLIFRWLVGRGDHRAVAASFLRLHCLPEVILSVGTVKTTIKHRTVGVFTGSRSAGAAGRIPLIDISLRRMHVWEQLAAKYGDVYTCIASFIDNIYTASFDPINTMLILSDVELQLNNSWRLQLGPASKFVMPAEGCNRSLLDHPGLESWPVVKTFKCLGQLLTHNCSISEDFNDAKKKMWASFWASFGPSMKRCSRHTKLRFLESSIKSLGRFRWSRWPYQRTYGKLLDHTQSHMLSLLFPTESIPGEAPCDYFRRRSLHAGRLAASCGRWSHSWADSVKTWHAHVMRDNRSWSKAIYEFHDSNWLMEQRSAWSYASNRHRTQTRAVRGCPAKRYDEGLEEALSLV